MVSPSGRKASYVRKRGESADGNVLFSIASTAPVQGGLDAVYFPGNEQVRQTPVRSRAMSGKSGLEDPPGEDGPDSASTASCCSDPSSKSSKDPKWRLEFPKAKAPKPEKARGPLSSRSNWKSLGDRVQVRVGMPQLSGRYHRLPRKLDDDYDVSDEVLGSGCGGRVLLATRKRCPEQKFALKKFRLCGLHGSRYDQLASEVEVFLSLDHPNIARLVDVYEVKDEVSILMECVEGGELFDKLAKIKRFGEREAAQITRQILMALNYMHRRGILHGDIKPENFMCEEKGDCIKLIDFGFSQFVDFAVRLEKPCGTIAYIAPEALELDFSTQNDMWSVGVVVFVLLAGYMPFKGAEKEQLQQIKDGSYNIKEQKWRTVSEEAKRFTWALLRVDPHTRLTAKTALEHSFVAKQGRSTFEFDVTSVVKAAEALCSFARLTSLRRRCLAMASWSLSSQERRDAEKLFLELDASHDGAVTFDSVAMLLEGHIDVSNSNLTTTFKDLDLYGDGTIHCSVFLAAVVLARTKVEHEAFHEVFRRFDTSKAGALTEHNLNEVLGDSFGQKSYLEGEVETYSRGLINEEDFVAFMLGKPLRMYGNDLSLAPEKKLGTNKANPRCREGGDAAACCSIQ
eukprot:TRINITY_DN76694_c0_g1_i1.p1 TRINITY_DN76694_c0_g1~~TRINITY_DN76694_c0_g1_i1.p1  ORF type:complete len:626 (+),score=118.07 TRINITY_DN76694_c0_g1_i1:129-2006(+)